MSLHIFLGDEVLFYFIVRVGVVKTQIMFEFKLVCNLQKDLKIKREFSNILDQFGPNLSLDLACLLPRADRTTQLASPVTQPVYGALPCLTSRIRPA
jgi:hypothetical protein